MTDATIRIHFPGSRQYTSIGEIENSEEVAGAEPGDIVKVMGTKEVVEKAAESLKVGHLFDRFSLAVPGLKATFTDNKLETRYHPNDLPGMTPEVHELALISLRKPSQSPRNTITPLPTNKTLSDQSGTSVVKSQFPKHLLRPLSIDPMRTALVPLTELNRLGSIKKTQPMKSRENGN